jgi:hypothetical protein
MVALTRPLIRTTATGRLGDPSGHILPLCFVTEVESGPPKGPFAMFGRKDYTQEELDNAKTAVNTQIAAYKQLAKVVDGAASDLRSRLLSRPSNLSSSTT